MTVVSLNCKKKYQNQSYTINTINEYQTYVFFCNNFTNDWYYSGYPDSSLENSMVKRGQIGPREV